MTATIVSDPPSQTGTSTQFRNAVREPARRPNASRAQTYDPPSCGNAGAELGGDKARWDEEGESDDRQPGERLRSTGRHRAQRVDDDDRRDEEQDGVEPAELPPEARDLAPRKLDSETGPRHARLQDG